MEKIHETLFILHKCDLNIRTVWEAISDHQSKRSALIPKHHYTINLSHYIILETQSFLEEYNKYFTPKRVEKKYSERILVAKKLCKPLVRQISKWKGLKEFRDNIVAHPWRNNSSVVVPLNAMFDIPRTWIEFQFLKDLIHYIHEILYGEFNLEMNEALFYAESLSENVPAKFTLDEINQEILSLYKELTKKSELQVRSYNIQIYTYQNPEEK